MLKRLKELRTSLDAEQTTALHDAFPGDIVERFFASEDEPSADTVVADLNKFLASRPMVAFELFKKLSSEQQAMISDLVFDDEDDE